MIYYCNMSRIGLVHFPQKDSEMATVPSTKQQRWTLWWTIFFLFYKWGICYPHPLQRHVETIQSIRRVIVNGASSGVHVLALHKSACVSLKTEWADLPPYVFCPSPPICTLLTISRLLTKPDPPPKSSFFVIITLLQTYNIHLKDWLQA